MPEEIIAILRQFGWPITQMNCLHAYKLIVQGRALVAHLYSQPIGESSPWPRRCP
jgi:hypothetical protein